MKVQVASVRALAMCVGLVAVCSGQLASPAFADDALGTGPDAFFRYYHKQRLDLALDASRVAVKAADAASVGKALATAGVAGATVTDANIKGWFLTSLGKALTPAELDALVAKLAADPGVEMVSPVFLDNFGGPMFVCGDLMVGFDAGTPAAERDAIIKDAGSPGTLKVRDYTPGVDRLTPASRNALDVLAAANALAMRGDVAFAEPDWAFTVREALIPNDTFFGNLWGINNTGQSGGTADQDMDGPEAWDITTGDNAVIVTVIDVGTELTHPDLNLAPGADFSGNGTNGGPFNSCDNHGTAVAGCVSAIINNGVGVVGIAPGCRVSPAKCFNSNLACDGSGSTAASWTVDALNFAQANGHRVTNNSNAYGGMFAEIDAAYQNTRDAGLVHFAATGNNGGGTISYPASIPVVNAVGAVDRNGNRASFSQHGPGTDFTAPGVDIDTTDRQGAAGYVSGDYVTASGTSEASPYAAGVAALVISRAPALTANQVETIMRNTAVDRGAPGLDDEYGAGFVNAFAAVQAAGIVPPTNDDCGNAIDVSAGGTFNGTLTAASNDGTAPCGGSASNPDVWYVYANPLSNTVVLTASTCGTHDTGGVDTGVDTVIAAFDTCGGTLLGCNDDAIGGGCGAADGGITRDSLIAFTVAGGQSAIIRVSKFGASNVGPFQLNISAVPVNDTCSSAVDVSAGGTFYGTLVGASNDGTATCGNSSANPDVWYTYTNPFSSPVALTASTCGTHDTGGQDAGVDTVLAAFDTCGGTQLACNDDAASGGCGAADGGFARDSLVSLNVAGGQSVLIRVSKYGASSVGPFQLHISAAAANDACASAVDVSAGGTFTGTLEGSTNDGTADCGSSATNPDVWYAYTNPGPCGATLTASTCGTHDTGGQDAGIDTVMTIFNGCGGAQLVCNDDADGDGCGSLDQGLHRDSYATVSVAGGQTVLIRVSKFGPNATASGTFRLNISTSNIPANDSCANALTIAAGADVPICTTGATTEGPTEAACTGFGDSNINQDVWFRYTPISTGKYTVQTCGSAFDTRLAAYTNTCPGSPDTALACNDDTCDLQSSITVVGAAGVPNLIRVGGFTTATGVGTLRVYCAADVNLSGQVTVQDIFDFLGYYFANDPRGDFNGAGGQSVQDIFDFLAAYFGGC